MWTEIQVLELIIILNFLERKYGINNESILDLMDLH